MKKIIAAIMIILGVCFIIFLLLKENNKTKSVFLDETFKLSLHEKVTISDADLQFRLESVGDSTCKSGMQCIWAGEYSYQIFVNETEIVLGTVTKRESNYNDYSIEIVGNDNTLEYVMLKVSKK